MSSFPPPDDATALPRVPPLAEPPRQATATRVPSPPDARWIDRAGGRAIAGAIRFVQRTSTDLPLMEETGAEMMKHHPMIIAMWHGQFMMLPIMMRFGLPVKAMLALHKDAEAMAEALRHFGVDLIRGAGAGGRAKDRGGAHAFRAALDALEAGYSVAMTADVPPGPARKAGHGIVTLAKVSGRPILPVAVASSRYLSLNSWSRMTINLPFSRLGGSIGEIVQVPRQATKDELEACRQEVERQLHIATFDSYLRANADPRRSTPGPALRVMGHRIQPGPSLRAYQRLTRMARPFLPILLKRRVARGKEDAHRLAERFGQASRLRPKGSVAWFHAASVGEMLSITQLIHELVSARPDVTVLLTTGTTAAAELAGKRMPPQIIHQYAPHDTVQSADAFLNHWQPFHAYFVESEIWPNMVLALERRSIPITLINARMSRISFRRWRFLSGSSRPIFSRIDRALTQNAVYGRYFQNLGVGSIITTGNLKIDSPALPVDEALVARMQADIGQRPVLLAVSTHPQEEEVVLAAAQIVRAAFPELLVIIAPRHAERGRAVADDINRAKVRVGRRADGKWPTRDTDVWVVDVLGELGSLFRLAPVAVMGGAFAKLGGHNPIEPIRAGVVPLTGPYFHNFHDEYLPLIRAEGAFVASDAAQLAQAWQRLMADAEILSTARASGGKVLMTLSGALIRTRDAVLASYPLASSLDLPALALPAPAPEDRSDPGSVLTRARSEPPILEAPRAEMPPLAPSVAGHASGTASDPLPAAAAPLAPLARGAPDAPAASSAPEGGAAPGADRDASVATPGSPAGRRLAQRILEQGSS